MTPERADRLTPRDYERLLEAADTYREALVVRLCGEVGLRPAELARLTPASIVELERDPTRYLVAVPPGDGDRSRRAYLPASLARELRRYVGSNGIGSDDRIFDVTPRRLQMLVAAVADRAGERVDDPALEAASTSDLRRFFARTALENDVNPRAVKAAGGWRSFEALEPYLPTPTDEEIVDAFAPLDDETPEVESPDGDERSHPPVAAAGRRATLRFDADGYVARWNRGAEAMFGYRADEIVGTHVSAFFEDEAVDPGGPERFRSTTTGGDGVDARRWRRADGSRFQGIEIVTPLGDGAEGGFSILVVDVTETVDRLEATGTATELEEEAAIGRCHRAVTAAILEASTHEDLEIDTCEALVDGDRYEAAWIDRSSGPARARLRTREWRTAVGIGTDEIERLASVERDESRDSGSPVSPREPIAGSAPEADSLRVTVESTVTGEIGGDRFVGALAAVPIGHGDTVYGTLSVATDREEAFASTEREWLERLGQQLGHAIAAVRQRNLLLSDTLLELEFTIYDRHSFFVDVSNQLGCRFELDSLVPVSESTQLYYVFLTGAAPADVFELAETNAGIGDCRLIETYEGGWRVEFVVEGSSATLTLTEYGVTVTEAVIDDGVATLTAECAADADLRTIVGGLRSRFPTSELSGKREVERSVQTAREFRAGLEGRLTDRQEATLRAAYFGGYYDWPRESTAEELADAMGISSPTLHNHLRKGQYELLRTFFDAESVDPGPR